MYYELTIDIMYDYGIDEPKGLPYDLDFISGALMTMPVDNPLICTTNASADDRPPDFWGSGFPVMSNRFVELLEEAGVDNLQKFPAIVKSEVDGAVWDNYFVVNILGIIKCADLDRSEYTEIFPGSYSFRELAINAHLAKDALLFRLQESASTILIHKSVGRYIGQMDPNREMKGWAAKKVIQ